jgi:hypothetical protein
VTDETEWGPWIDHDGTGCPVVGMWVHGVERGGFEDIWIAGTVLVEGFTPVGRVVNLQSWRCRWSWAVSGNVVERFHHIIRYRVRKPRALRELIEMVENLPAPQKQLEEVGA